MFSFQISCQNVAVCSFLMLKGLQAFVSSSLSFVFVFRVCSGLCESVWGHKEHLAITSVTSPFPGPLFALMQKGTLVPFRQLKPHTVLGLCSISVQCQVCTKTFFGLWASKCRWTPYGCYLPRQTCSIMFEVGIRLGRIWGSKMLDAAYYVGTAYISELSNCILLNAAIVLSWGVFGCVWRQWIGTWKAGTHLVPFILARCFSCLQMLK